jgi:hypothetical protein
MLSNVYSDCITLTLIFLLLIIRKELLFEAAKVQIKAESEKMADKK